MSGAEAVLRTAVSSGIDTCFANPGTTELAIVTALGRVRELRPVLGLFEGVCAGAADGYARMTGRPALGLYHLGPGFANSLANQHNARRALTSMVNLIGDHATWHLGSDPPLASDIDAVAGWAGHVLRITDADEAAATMAAAIAKATSGAGRVTSVVLPADCAESETTQPVASAALGTRAPVPPARIEKIAVAMRRPKAAVVSGGAHLSEVSVRALGRIREATGCAVWSTRTARVEMGRSLPAVEELPYFPEPARRRLDGLEVCVLAGTAEPITFFGYEGQPSNLLPDTCERVVLAEPDDDVEAALVGLADALDAGGSSWTEPDPLEVAAGALNPESLGRSLALSLPEGCIVVYEALTSGLPFRVDALAARPFTLLNILGGAIGGGLPTAVGAATGCPDRPVVALQADGSAMYTIQALWTAAHEDLDLTVVLCNNRKYRILETELERAGIDEPGPAVRSLIDLSDPDLDFVALAAGLGVPGVRVTEAEALTTELERSYATPGPRLIDAIL